MDKGLKSIGDVARTSGLTVSALRFYDRVGVLNPLMVDPTTSYRWYSPNQVKSAELIAKLRQVGLALPEISTVLEHQGESRIVEEILTEHIARLEAGLMAAKESIGQITQWWVGSDQSQPNSNIVVNSSMLRQALESVRFAIGVADDLPTAQGILLEVDGMDLRLTATDRYRAAFHTVQVASGSTEFRVILAAAGVDELLNMLTDGTFSRLTITTDLLVSIGSHTLHFPIIRGAFPNLLGYFHGLKGSKRIAVDRMWLRGALRDDRDSKQESIRLSFEDELVINPGIDQTYENTLALNTDYLAEAVDAGIDDRLELEFSGGIAPLAIRNARSSMSFSVLMPIVREYQ